MSRFTQVASAISLLCRKMSFVHRLGLWDYGVIAASLLLNLCIGIRYNFSNKKSSRDFMLADSNMSMLPVILSLAATHMSAVLMLGVPAEIYRYGSQWMVLAVGVVAGIVLSAHLLVPIYFDLGVCTIYEYLEMRFGKFIRISVSGFFLVQTLLLMSVVLNAPALALSAVTDLTPEISILITGIVCITYCTLGGLRAVLWTDAFQSFLMFACLLAVFAAGIAEVGGPAEVVRRSKAGRRWEFFNINMDLTTRMTFWNVLFRGLSIGIGNFGTNQMEMQRLFTLNHIKKAQSALLWSMAPMLIIAFMSYSMGLILYAVFYHCDPVVNGGHTGVRKHDQLVPYYIVTRFGHLPGLTGLCVAGLFSGSLSTVSSAVNSAATVTVLDFLQPYCPCWPSEESTLLWITKILVVLYGGLCIGLTFLLSNVGSLTQMANTAMAVVEGPVVAVFLLGILTVRTNEKGSAVGLFAGCLFCGWIGYGSILSGYVYPPLPTSSENCSSPRNVTQVQVANLVPIDLISESDMEAGYLSSNVFLLYRISYLWIPTLGFVCTVAISYVVSFVIHCEEPKKVNGNLLSPAVRKWMTNSALYNTDEVSMGTQHCSAVPDDTSDPIKRKVTADCSL